MQRIKQTQLRVIFCLMTILTSGLLFYFSTGFNNQWYLLWIAPIPLLLFALYSKRKLDVIIVSILSSFIGGASIFGYIGTHIPAAMIVIPTIVDALIFSVLILITRHVVVNMKSLPAVFMFPTLLVSYEWLTSLSSPNGAVDGFGYSQFHFTSLMQIVSITGIWGITFCVMLFASAISCALYFPNRRQKALALLIAVLTIVLPMLYGTYRINHYTSLENQVAVGLIDLNGPHYKDEKGAIKLSQQYIDAIPELVKKGAKHILLPEKFIRIDAKALTKVNRLFAQAAKKNHVTILAGIGRRGKQTFNSVIVYNPEGKISGIYDKHHLVPGLEDHITPQSIFLTFKSDPFNWGTAICKDMDFTTLGKTYGQLGVDVLFVPALDFYVDAWTHAAVAMTRGIENGYSIVRVAGQGYLTITDPFGRILAKQGNKRSGDTQYVTNVPIIKIQTFYSQFGDWFEWLCLILAVMFLVLSLLKSKKLR